MTHQDMSAGDGKRGGLPCVVFPHALGCAGLVDGTAACRLPTDGRGVVFGKRPFGCNRIHRAFQKLGDGDRYQRPRKTDPLTSVKNCPSSR